MTTVNNNDADTRYNPDAQEELSVQRVITDKPAGSPRKPWSKPVKVAFKLATTGAVVWAGYGVYNELMTSSTLQSKFFTKLANGEIFTRIVTTPPPAEGNTDVERGYADIPRIRKLAEKAGDKVSPQVEWKDRRIGPLRLAPIFPRPSQAGVTILDNSGQVMYRGESPHDVYKTYGEIPELLVHSLCIVEDKNICDPNKSSTFNAAINWPRAGWAAVLGIGRKVNLVSKVEGGSTLPIQITKNDSWEKGRTKGFTDKAEQMLTASTEMYEYGPDTRRQRQAKILEYVNTASFAGHPAFGEIKGVKDAMAILMSNNQYDEALKNPGDTVESAHVFRQVFSLIMAVKMPDESLRSKAGFAALQERVDNFLPLLVEEGAITQSFADKVRAVKIEYADIGKNPLIPPRPARDKFVDSMRLSVMNKLQLKPVDGMYRLDRWDLKVDGTLDHSVNEAVTAKLKSYNDPETAKRYGLTGFQLLRPETAPKVTWAIAINERLPDGRVVTRVSTDTFKGSLDLTKGGRQNYGSTGKMRMAATFLDEVIAELHDKLSTKTPEDLGAIKVHSKDKLTRWAVNYLSNPENDHSLIGMQRAAISTIPYSGHPQGFFTGGGMNYPGNFDRREDSKNYTVEEALWESVNLSWYRITDDIEEYMKWNRLAIDAGILDEGPFTPEQEQLRKKYLEEFADFEGAVFSGRFWRQQKDRIASELAEALTDKKESQPAHMTGLYLGFYPEASYSEYERFMTKSCRGCVSKTELRALFDDNKKKSQSSAASLLATHTDGSVKSLMTLFRFTTPGGTYDQAKAFILAQKPDLSKDVILTDAYTSYQSPVPQAVLDLLVEKAKGAKTKLAVVYMTLNPDASYEDFERFIRRECATCSPKDDFRKLYDEHKPERQIDILSVMARNTDRSPGELINLYRSIDPAAAYQTVRQFIANESPQADPFKSFEKEYYAFKAMDSEKQLELFAHYTDRSPEQLSALYGRLRPHAPLEDMKAFVQAEMVNKKLRPDFKKFHERYASGKYDPAALFYKFDLNDRGYLARPIHPLELAIAAQRVKSPEITWKQALLKTAPDRIHVYKWLIHSNKKKAQDKSIGIILDHHAWREIEKSWQKLGFPFKLVPSLATVIGVSGDTADSLATFNAILLNQGKSVNTTRFTGLHFGVGTPHETHITPGQPASVQVMRPETAQLMLEMTQGIVSSDHGTGRRLKDGFKLSDGTTLIVRGKTGTNDESETSGIRVGAFSGTIDDRFSFCISGYITGASSKDKFTSGMAVQALKMLAPELQPLFDRSYGVTPTPAGILANHPKPEIKTLNRPSPVFSSVTNPVTFGNRELFPAAKDAFRTSTLLDYDTGTWYLDTQPESLSKRYAIRRKPEPAPE